MRKKLIAIISIVAVIISLVACGESTNTVPDAIEETVEEIAEETVETTVEEPKEEVIEEPEEVVEEVTEESKEVAEEVIEEPKEVAEKVEEEVVAVEAEPAEVAYTYSDTSATMYAKSTVNVRDLPDKIGNKVGSLSQNQEVTVTGKCNETGWYRIEYNGSTAYVSNDFLVNEKVEVAPPAETNPPADNGGGQAATGQYPYYTWIDKDFYFVWYGQSQDDIATKFNFADTDIYCNILKERYPGYPDATAAGISDGKYAPVTYICFLYNAELKQTYPANVISTYER